MCSKISVCEKIVYEKEFSRFLIKRIKHLGGSIKLQHITGHVSQVKLEIRETVGSSQSDILNFIKRYSNIFHFDNNNVTLVDNSVYENDFDDDSSVQVSLPFKISKGVGVIVKLFPTYGFIKVKDPVKTSVFFSVQNFLNYGIDKERNLIDHGLNIGTMVNFNAVKEKTDNFKSKYRAIKVWKSSKADVENNIVHISRKNRKSELYDPVNLDGEGTIQKVLPNLGFIAINGNEKNTVFFYKNRVVNYDNIFDLTDVFDKGDLVEFSAHRSTKQDAKARWEAIRVWNKSGKNISYKTQEKDEVPRSDSVTSSNHSKLSSNSASLTKGIKQKISTREMIHDQSGKICPRCSGTVIKFGENFTQLADGDSSVYYISGAQVTDVSWEFSDGDEVKFDAVKIKSAPGWKAVLVWAGSKPDIVLPTCLGDFSAFADEEVSGITEDSSSSVSGNYLPESSCSQKSISMKSEPCNSKTLQLFEDSCNLQDSHVQKGIHTHKKNDIKEESTIRSISPYSSQSSLSSFNDTKLISSLFKEKLWENEPNSIKYESDITQAKTNLPITSVSKNYYFRDTHEDEQESISEYSSVDLNEEKSQLSEFSVSSKSSEESENLKDIKISECKDSEVKKAASIKEFQDMVGLVTTVYAIFAKMKCSEQSESFVFFRNIFYYKSRENVEINDLRKVLKVGCTVHFNYFEIVDDFGQSWNKVSLVWNGLKPLKFKEITPGDYIQQSSLSVTIINKPNNVQPLKEQDTVKIFLSAVNDVSTENKLDNINPPLQQQQPVKKFLSTFSDISPEDKLDECISQTESFSNDNNENCDKILQTVISTEMLEAKMKSTDDIKMLSDLISHKLLKNQNILMDSMVDYNSLSSEIVNIVVNSIKSKEYRDCAMNNKSLIEDCSDETSNALCFKCQKKMIENANTRNTEVQTIFTGEVMAQNVFTQC